jgi:two-component system sensor histidine kinase QseC
LEPIGRRLNDLLSRLETSFERERRFSADVAHELRTPLAELRSLAELAMKWPESRPAEADRDVLAIATQMESLVTRLLAMIRSDHGRVPVSREPINLGALLQEVWKPLAPRALAARLCVTWDVPPASDVSTDGVLVRSILMNVLQNAVEYTPPGGAIAINARIDHAGFQVRVRNGAGALSSDDVTRLFERFWRHDPSRSGAEHAGLGLPLAESFARALGGTLTAELDPARQLTLTLHINANAVAS